MNRRVAISPALFSLFMERQKELKAPIVSAHMADKLVVFVELGDYEYMEFNSDLLEIAPSNTRSVVSVTLNDGTTVASWYFDIEENK